MMTKWSRDPSASRGAWRQLPRATLMKSWWKSARYSQSLPHIKQKKFLKFSDWVDAIFRFHFFFSFGSWTSIFFVLHTFRHLFFYFFQISFFCAFRLFVHWSIRKWPHTIRSSLSALACSSSPFFLFFFYYNTFPSFLTLTVIYS